MVLDKSLAMVIDLCLVFMVEADPNGAQLYNLRNLPFSIQVGQQDYSYSRNGIGEEYIQKLNDLSKQFGGFKNYSRIHKKLGHWMMKKDAFVFPLLFNHIRDPYPEYILFKQHERIFIPKMYYLKIEEKHKGLIILKKQGNIFYIQSDQKIPVTIMLNSRMINFDEQAQIYHNGDQTVQRKPIKSQKLIKETIYKYLDFDYIFEDQMVSIPLRQLGQNAEKLYLTQNQTLSDKINQNKIKQNQSDKDNKNLFRFKCLKKQVSNLRRINRKTQLFVFKVKQAKQRISQKVKNKQQKNYCNKLLSIKKQLKTLKRL